MNKIKVFSIFLIIMMLLNICIPTVNLAHDEISELNFENVEENENIEKNNINTYNLEEKEGASNNLEIRYSSHVQDYGWEEDFCKSNGAPSGTTGQNKKIEAMKINLANNEEGTEVRYSVYVENNGWQEVKTNGEIAGSEGRNLKMLGIKIELVNLPQYSVKYRIHVEDFGWKDWAVDGQKTETIEDGKKIEAIEIELVPKIEQKLSVQYSSHVQDYGWEEQFSKSDAETSGTTGKNKKVEAIKIRLVGNEANTGIKYRAYVENKGWMAWQEDGDKAGSTGENLKLLGLKIELINMDSYSVLYRVHVEDYGWTNWFCDGETAGKVADSKKIEAIEVKITPKIYKLSKSIAYTSFIENEGWEEEYLNKDGESSGSTGKNLKMLGLQVKLMNFSADQHVKYKLHVENYGWLDWVRDGEITGKITEEMKIEAIQIELENIEEYTVEYRAHVQDYGWQNWMIDGEIAGTFGQNKKIEAIQIRLVPKYKRQYKGIDVSKHNGEIDWQAVKNDGIDFAIIRVGYGQDMTSQDDQRAEYNMRECERLGIPYGVYLYSYALDTNNALSEADHVLRMIKGHNPSLGIYLDVEDDAYYTKYGFPTNEMFVNIITTFCEKMKANGYEKVGIYANLTWLNGRLNDSRLDKYYKWVAQWNDKCTYKQDYIMWQYADDGRVSGINTNVDMNIYYGQL